VKGSVGGKKVEWVRGEKGQGAKGKQNYYIFF